MNPETLKGLAVSAAVSAAVSFGMLHITAAPLARASLAEIQLNAAAPESRREARRVPSAPSDDSIHEAYSDGGYQDWVDQQRAP